MTLDLPPSVSLPLVGGAFIAVVAWVVRKVLFDPIEQLRAANIRQGKRLGRLRSWMVAHDAVERAAGRMPIGDWSEDDE